MLRAHSMMIDISRWLSWLAGAAILFGCAVPVAIDVIARMLIGRALLQSVELSGYAMAACIGLGMGWTAATNANVRVDIVTARLPRRYRIVTDVLASLAIAATALALAGYSYGVLAESWRLGARSESTLMVPMVLPQGIWWVGLVWFAVVACLVPVLAFLRILQRDLAGAEALIGSPSLKQELERGGIRIEGHGA